MLALKSSAQAPAGTQCSPSPAGGSILLYFSASRLGTDMITSEIQLTCHIGLAVISLEITNDTASIMHCQFSLPLFNYGLSNAS